MTASTYSQIFAAVDDLIAHHRLAADKTVCAYMIARSALLCVKSTHGAEKAAELAYKLADELVAPIAE